MNSCALSYFVEDVSLRSFRSASYGLLTIPKFVTSTHLIHSCSIPFLQLQHTFSIAAAYFSIAAAYLFHSCGIPFPQLLHTFSIAAAYIFHSCCILFHCCCIPFSQLRHTFSIAVAYLFHSCCIPFPQLRHTFSRAAAYFFHSCAVTCEYTLSNYSENTVNTIRLYRFLKDISLN